MYTDSGKLPVQAPVQQMLDGMHSVLKRNENIVQNSDKASYLVAKIIISSTNNLDFYRSIIYRPPLFLVFWLTMHLHGIAAASSKYALREKREINFQRKKLLLMTYIGKRSRILTIHHPHQGFKRSH